jgi:vacuolar protein sorting-associated protein VTA1
MSVIGPVKPYFKYAMDLEAADPIVAYYCKLYGVQEGFGLVKKAPESADVASVKQFLMGELSSLESLKANALQGQSNDDMHPHVENFILSMFARVDKDERTCP